MSSPCERQIITTVLHGLGVPTHIAGFKYLREAVLFAANRPDRDYSMTKDLYPTVARHFSTKPSRVERAMRHAVTHIWDCGYIEKVSLDANSPVYGLRRKPTNSQLISMVADWLRLYHKVG